MYYMCNPRSLLMAVSGISVLDKKLNFVLVFIQSIISET